MKKQVDKEHYIKKDYLNKERFLNYFYQIDPILKLNPKSILEIGVGNNIVYDILKKLGYDVTGVDIAEDLKPDKICSVNELSKCFKENSFDLILCAEVLEHLPFDQFEKSLQEISKVTKKYAIISLPYAGPSFTMSLKLPLLNLKKLSFKFPVNSKHKFDGEHYWEIGKKGHLNKNIVNIIKKYFNIKQSFVPFDDSAHSFFILEKKNL